MAKNVQMTTPLERLKAYQAEAQSPDLALALAVVDAFKAYLDEFAAENDVAAMLRFADAEKALSALTEDTK